MSIYLDHAATTPIREVALRELVDKARMLNPGGQYASGRAARRVLDDAREKVAFLLGADPAEVIFTASGTESDNIAVQGLYFASENNRVVSTPVEHSAVKDTVSQLPGAQIDLMPVDSTGHINDVSAVETPAALACCMWANNETGAVQPIAQIAQKAADSGTSVHIDAVQVVGKFPIDFHELGITTLAASAHKFGGPRGVGILLARRSPAPKAIIHGGGQERALRPGTVNVAGAAALAAALEESLAEHEVENARQARLRDELRDDIVHQIPDVVVHTQEPALPSHLHLSFPGAAGDSLIMLLDAAGVEASTGSACSQGVNRASHVLEAMGVATDTARGALRLTLGRTTTENDIRTVSEILPRIVEQARHAGLS
ncbi:aminotransferase class V-fold PLP-dependent enzyme [Corynebacterium sp. 3HC-13]|uniref:cysteine desulfurase family protein n=1 Tax=Corynebacterium poyangense TaxID=2684405 RepID=UPI001CCFD94E|nr:cysteine desulfurase family protein [Corynebacterium poyangense]MBZ8177101.1 aminotransferase class V-fold PLP-dependent enzyme [Corynebacterium poyangense]